MQPQATALTEPIIRPPSPDFSSLSPDELNQLEIVLQKQVLIENEQNQCLSGLRRTMVHLQQMIQNDYQRQRHSSSTHSHNSSPTQQNQIVLSSSDIVQCYICYSNIEVQSKDLSSSPPILCADCHRPVCRRCGNYTSPELINISERNHFENQTHTCKWRCRMCIVRREVIRKSGSWNTTEDEVPVHSPVRLLQKLAAFRASTGSTPISSSTSPSPSPQHERKSKILSESTNFFTRLWRPNTHQLTPSQILMASHETNSSSFDQIPEPTATLTDTSTVPSLSPRSNHRISFIRDVSSKSPTQLCQFSSPLVQAPVPLQPQPTTSSIITDPSFEDTTSEQPCDTASEFYSQSFETNMDSSNPKIVDEENSEKEQGLTYDERHRRLSLSAKPVIQTVQKISSLPLRMTEQHRSESLTSPEANIDVSMAMDYFSTPIITTPSITENSFISNNNDNNNHHQQQTNSTGVRNSDTWARKRTLMHRDYQWTTTLEDVESITNNNNNQYNSTCNPTVLSDSTTNSLTYKDKKNSSSSSTRTNSKTDSSNAVLRRRRSSRRLPEIPLNCKILSNNNQNTNSIDEIKFLPSSSSSSYTSHEQPSQIVHENSLCNRSTCSKSINSDSSLASRLIHTKLLHTHQSPNTKSVDLSNLTRRKSFLIVNNTLLPQRSLDYPCIVRKAPDLSDIVRQRMLYSKMSKQQQGENFSLSLEREHVPKVPRKIIIRQDNSIEIALSKPPKLRRQTLSEEFCYGCNPEVEFTSMSPITNASSTLGLPIPSSGSGLTGGDRRKTIETCENIYLHAEESSKLRARTPPSNPHRILLHRDKNDTSIRTNGLGMRIIGGQECEDSSLGCFVTNILYGGPADVQGNIEVGDQILEFNGHSLIESTYEEVRILQDHCGDIVQLVVQHNNVRLQINNGQTLSSIEISRHFETVPRLSSSLTRKRRNLPPLPPSLSSTIPKQKKKELYETVETLEVPNVKELKPILINRGRLLAQIWHDVDDMKLALTIIQASHLALRSNGDQPYAFITGKMLFEDRGFDMFETKIIHSSNPVYNETFVFHEVESVDVLHLEILLWDKKQYQTNNDSTDESDDFLGMIQLPLNEANLEDEPRWYELRDRQTRKPSASSVTFKSSSIESADSCRKMPPLLLSNKHDERTKTSTDALIHTINSSMINKIDSNRKNSSSQTTSKHANTTGSTIPTIIMTNIDDGKNDEDTHRRLSAITIQSVKLKRRISKGISKLFDVHTRRFSESTPESPKSPASRKLSSQIDTNIDKEHHIDISAGLTLDNTSTNINKSPRQSLISTINQDEQQQQTLIRPIPLQQMPIGQLMLPYIPSSRHSSISGSRKSSATSNLDSDDDIDRYFTLSEQQQEQINDNNNVQTHTVGPGQVTPRNYENMIHDYMHMGKIQLGLVVTKGLLEIDIISAKGLERIIDDNSDNNNNNNNGAKAEDIPPDTYVKTYLRTGTRRVQKRKTATTKGSYNPEYHSKLKYNACNVMGRRLQVTVWQRGGKFEKNQCIGEAYIQLDNLTLNQHTIAWYTLFREKLVESEFYDSS